MVHRVFSAQLFVAVLVAVFVIAVTVMAGGDAVGESKPAVSTENSLEGTLIALESYGHILIRPEVGNLMRLRVKAGAIITRNGNSAKVGDLRTGDKVRAKVNSNNWVSELHATGT